MVLDDRDASREVVTALLQSWGYRTSEAADAGSAIELLRQAAREGDPFSVALVDQVMPGTDGEEVAQRIAADPLLSGTALLLMAPFGEHGPAPRVRDCAFACVSKPVIEGRLREALTEALGRGKTPDPVSTPRPAITPHAGVPSRRARVLLAEDNAVNRELFLALLARQGPVADAVSDGAQAVLAVRKTAYDLVFMDCEMPEMDGYEATRLIRIPETGALNPRVPIVAVTANAMPGDRERCLRQGMDDYLPKPIEPGRLAGILAKWLPAPGPDGKPVSAGGAPPAPAECVFDEAGLLKRLGGNKALAQRLVQGFLEEVPSQLGRLRQQLAEQDATGARRQAHTLKGAAANLSAGALRAVAFQAEQAAMGGELARIAELLPTMEGEIARLAAVLRQAAWT